MSKTKIPKTWKQVCKRKGISEAIPFDVSMLPKEQQNYLIAAYQLPIIIEVRNDGWAPDYANRNQLKFELWLEVIEDKSKPSGFGLSFDDVGGWRTDTVVGVRFCFKDKATAKLTFDDFQEVFENFMLKVG